LSGPGGMLVKGWLGLLPIFGPGCWAFSSQLRSARAVCRWPIDQLDRGFVADRAVWSLLVVVPTPSLAFSPRIVEAHEPMRVQAFRSEFAIERLDEGIVSGLAWSGEVERDTTLVSPQIEIA